MLIHANVFSIQILKNISAQSNCTEGLHFSTFCLELAFIYKSYVGLILNQFKVPYRKWFTKFG